MTSAAGFMPDWLKSCTMAFGPSFRTRRRRRERARAKLSVAYFRRLRAGDLGFAPGLGRKMEKRRLGKMLSPGCRSVGLCRALSVLCRPSVGPLSDLCRLTEFVKPLSAAVGLCRPLSVQSCPVRCLGPVDLCRSVETLSVCRSVGLSVVVARCRLAGGSCRVVGGCR